jgi:hypothetical protein
MDQTEPGPPGNVADGSVAVRGRVVCDVRFSACHCYEERGHPGIHVCRCEGSWDDQGRVHSLPNLFWPESGPG